jgi:hypothetical protein
MKSTKRRKVTKRGFDPRLAVLISTFAEEAASIVDAFAAKVGSDPAPAHVYHYTNDTGLRGILESGDLWLTDMFTLNDPSELAYGVSRALENLRARAGSSAFRMFSDNFIKVFEGSLRTSAHFFVCSFSMNGDELGQWRGYGDDGRGYALGFDGKMLEDAFIGADGVRRSTFTLTYDDDALGKLQDAVVASIVPFVDAPYRTKYPDRDLNPYMAKLSVQLAIYVLYSAIFFKHEAYRAEAEYRFLQMHRIDRAVRTMKYRGRPHTLVRYTTFDWKRRASEALREIVIGPAAELQTASHFIGDCLRAFHADPGSVRIVRSKIPYRGRTYDRPL